MRNQKKSFTLIELIVFILILSFSWIYTLAIFQNFFNAVEKNQKIKNFSQDYKKMKNYIYKNWYNYWDISQNSPEGIIMYNEGKKLWYSWYIWYKCMWSWLWITYIHTWANIDRNKFQKTFTGFECRNLTGRKSNWWYWLNFNLKILSKNNEFKYYIHP